MHTVGARSWYRHSLKGAQPPYAGASVPCGSCTACCTGLRAPLVPGLDHISTYATDPDEAEPVLSRKADGSCLYLHEGACLIYARRPFVCRTFDCRALLVTNVTQPLHVYQAAAEKFAIAMKEPDDAPWLTAVRVKARVLEVQGKPPADVVREALIEAV